MRGMFISFEGPDGSGKSTHIRFLNDWLTKMGHAVLITREPGGCPIAEIIRELVLSPDHGEMTAETEALLYAAARAQHVAEVIRPALERGEIVITDRYIDSSVAYQGYGRKLGEDVVWAINGPAIGGLLPDVTFFMAVDELETARRISDRDLDRLEQAGLGFHGAVYEAFRMLANKHSDRIVTIDATRPKPEVREAVFAAVRERMEKMGICCAGKIC